MNVLHTWAIIGGVAAVALPLVIHWLTRPKPKRLPFSTVRFVREVLQQRRSVHRIRDAIILAARIAAVLLLAGAFARPFFGAKRPTTEGESAETVRVVVLDTSLSMGASVRGVQLFEQARAAAAGYLTYSPSVHANLVLAGAQPKAAFERASANFGALREELAKAAALPQRLNIEATINLASDILARSGNEKTRRELVIVSDFQRSNWAAADFQKLPKNTTIKYESVAPTGAMENVGILRVAAQRRVEVGRPVNLEVDVGNYTGSDRKVEVEVSIGGASWKVEGNCAKGVKTTLTKEIAIGQGGWQSGEARLVGVDDALAADNRRAFVIEVRPAPAFALVTREPSRLPANSSHYLERALNPGKAREGVERVMRVDPGAIDQQALARADVIVVSRPGKLSAEAIGQIVSLMKRGKGVLYVACDVADATNLKMLGEAAGTDLKLPVEFVPAAVGQVRKDLFILDPRKDQAPFSVFGGDLAGVAELRFGGGLLSRPVLGGLREEILASYSDQSACLVCSACGAGAIAILNADLGQSTLPGSGVFVPIVSELVDRLMAGRRSADSVACGERFAAILPAEAGVAADLVIDGAAEGSAGELVDDRGSVVWNWNAAGAAGIYQVKRKDRGGSTVYALATAAPAQESELSYLDRSILTQRLAGGRDASFQNVSDSREEKDTAWTWLLVVCAGCMLVEIVAMRMFRT